LSKLSFLSIWDIQGCNWYIFWVPNNTWYQEWYRSRESLKRWDQGSKIHKCRHCYSMSSHFHKVGKELSFCRDSFQWDMTSK
jgi:hypothetical protein